MGKTAPQDIKEPNYQRLWKKLQELTYPCTVVVYGSERTQRTTYRGEHQGAFGIAYCNSAEEAWNVVDCGWPGYPPDLEVYSITGEPQKLSVR